MPKVSKKKAPNDTATIDSTPASAGLVKKIPRLRSKHGQPLSKRTLLILVGILLLIVLGFLGWHHYQSHKKVQYPKGKLLPQPVVRIDESAPSSQPNSKPQPARTGR